MPRMQNILGSFVFRLVYERTSCGSFYPCFASVRLTKNITTPSTENTEITNAYFPISETNFSVPSEIFFAENTANCFKFLHTLNESDTVLSLTVKNKSLIFLIINIASLVLYVLFH